MEYSEPAKPDELPGRTPWRFAFQSVRTSQQGDMEYMGTMDTIIADATEAAAHNTLRSNYWTPARLVRGILDHHPHDAEGHVDLVNHATSAALGMYAGQSSPERLEDLRTKITAAGLGEIAVEQEWDHVTLKASAAKLSRSQAAAIAQEVEGPKLILPICHGGFVAAVQTALYLEKKDPGSTSVYPIRVSMQKIGDHAPHLSDDEVAYLAQQAEDKTVIAYDEDSGSGKTMATTVSYLRQVLPDGQHVLGWVNTDNRIAENRKWQGPHWEGNVDQPYYFSTR